MNSTTLLRSLATIAAGVHSEKPSSSRGSYWTRRVESTHQKQLIEKIETLSKEYLNAFCEYLNKMDAYTSLVIGLEPLAGSEVFEFYELPLRNLFNTYSKILDSHQLTQNSPVPQKLAMAYFQYKTKLFSITTCLINNNDRSRTLNTEELQKTISIFEKMIPFLKKGETKFITDRETLGNYILTSAQPAAPASQSSSSSSSLFKTLAPQQIPQRRSSACHSAQSVAQVASQIINQRSSSSSSTQNPSMQSRQESPVRIRKRSRDEKSSSSSDDFSQAKRRKTAENTSSFPITITPPENTSREQQPSFGAKKRRPFRGYQIGFLPQNPTDIAAISSSSSRASSEKTPIQYISEIHTLEIQKKDLISVEDENALVQRQRLEKIYYKQLSDILATIQSITGNNELYRSPSLKKEVKSVLKTRLRNRKKKPLYKHKNLIHQNKSFYKKQTRMENQCKELTRELSFLLKGRKVEFVLDFLHQNKPGKMFLSSDKSFYIIKGSLIEQI